MELISTTPFGARPATAGLIRREDARRRIGVAQTPPRPQVSEAADKWALLRALAAARSAFGISDRDLTVLAALLSFHPVPAFDAEDAAAPIIVHPSNAALCSRAHGMAESTVRRHLAALVTAGLIRRHDSPNGKRYVARDASGLPVAAFGFDLEPLRRRSAEILAAARAADEASFRIKRLREAISLHLRDADKLASYGLEHRRDAADLADVPAALAALRKRFRRRLAAVDLEALLDETKAILAGVEAAAGLHDEPDEFQNAENMSGNANDSGRDHQNSTSDVYESEQHLEQKKKVEAGSGAPGVPQAASENDVDVEEACRERRLSLWMVQDACPEIAVYAGRPIATWRDLCAAADIVRPMLGVSADAWSAARRAMGDETAAVTLAAILERYPEIQSPGGYLRALTKRAETRGFSPLPMVSALLNAARPSKCP